MPSRSRLSQITSEILQAIDKAPDVETAIESLASRAPTDPAERHHFDSVIAIARVSSKKPAKHTLVFVIHGIRDEGPWMDMVRDVIESKSVTVKLIDFDDFGAGRFLFGIKVKSVIEASVQKMRHAISYIEQKHGDVRLMAIGHSFGTYVLLKVLDDNPDLAFERMIFCGSVAPRKYRYDKLKNAPQMVNDCGARDIWPIIAGSFGWKDYGAAGVWGIRVANVDDRYHDFGHSDYLTREFAEQYWRPFIASGTINYSAYQKVRRPAPRGLRLLGYGYNLLAGIACLALSPCLFAIVFKENYVNARWIAAIIVWTVAVLLVGWITLGTIRFLYPDSFRRPSKDSSQQKRWGYLHWGAVLIVVLTAFAVVWRLAGFTVSNSKSPSRDEQHVKDIGPGVPQQSVSATNEGAVEPRPPVHDATSLESFRNRIMSSIGNRDFEKTESTRREKKNAVGIVNVTGSERKVSGRTGVPQIEINQGGDLIAKVSITYSASYDAKNFKGIMAEYGTDPKTCSGFVFLELVMSQSQVTIRKIEFQDQSPSGGHDASRMASEAIKETISASLLE